MYFEGFSSSPLCGHSLISRFWARLTSEVSAMMEWRNFLRISSHSEEVNLAMVAVDSVKGLGRRRVLDDLGGELHVVVGDAVGFGALGAHEEHGQAQRHGPAHNHRVPDLGCADLGRRR